MAGDKITILEQLDINGGCLDGNGSATDGYLMRSGQKMGSYYECIWDPNSAKCRLMNNCGKPDRDSLLELHDLFT
ncbi:oleate hydratase [Desulfobulbus sp. TB]|nr:oleate hydratase [Desulfobulbus sp. TB]